MKGKIILIASILSLFFAACSSSKNLTSTKQDKELFNAINAVEKSNNTEAKKDLPLLYQQAVQRHEDQIASFKTSEDPERWNSIIGELEALQKIYSAINASSTVSKLVSAQNYSTAIADARKTGAEEYYGRGLQYLQSEEREDARKAYQAFQAVNRIYPNYRDASALQKKAEEKEEPNEGGSTRQSERSVRPVDPNLPALHQSPTSLCGCRSFVGKQSPRQR